MRALAVQLLPFLLAWICHGPAHAGPVLRVLAWPGYADADVVKAFEQRHGARVEVTLVSTDDELWTRLANGRGANYDVFAANTAELQRFVDEGISVPLDPAALPNTARQLARFRDFKAVPGLMRGAALHAVPFTYSEMGLIYDRRQVPQAPDSFAALWEPRYKGRVLNFQGSTHNFSLAALALGIDPYHIEPGQFAQVARHLVALRRNSLAFYGSPEEATTLFMQHRAALLFANFGTQQVAQLRKAGADIGYVVPKGGAMAWLDAWALARGVADRKLAHAWINYTLEPQVSRLLSSRHGLANTLEQPASVPDGSRLLWLERVEDPERRAGLWRKIYSGDRLERFGP